MDIFDDSPLPSTKKLGRFSHESLARAAKVSPKPRPALQTAKSNAPRPSKVELLQRAQEVDRMAARLSVSSSSSSRRSSAIPQQPPSAEDAEAPSAFGSRQQLQEGLGMSQHLAALSAAAVPPAGSSDEHAARLDAALADAAHSLARCEQQQLGELQSSIEALRALSRAAAGPREGIRDARAGAERRARGEVEMRRDGCADAPAVTPSRWANPSRGCGEEAT